MSKNIRYTILAVIALLVISGSTIIQLYTDWLWFDSLGYSTVFSTILWSKIALGVGAGLIFFLVVYANLWLSRKLVPPPTNSYTQKMFLDKLGLLAKRGIGMLTLLVSVGLAVMVGLEASGYFKEWLYWINSVPFGQTDPVLNVDISFYVFKLAFAEFLYTRLFFMLIVCTAATGLLYFADDAVHFRGSTFFIAKKAKVHMAILCALLFFVKAYGYRLAMFGLLNAQGQQFDGPGYTIINANLPAMWALLVLAVIGGFVCFIGVLSSKSRLLIGAVGVQVVASLLLGAVYPSLLQRLVVKPNQQEKETPYITKHIKATQMAYGLDNIAIRKYPADTTLDTDQIAANTSTIENTRLWDSEHISGVYSQMQTIQQYYHFNNVDVDRYWLGPEGGEKRYRQVWLAARELSQDSLPSESQTWVNKRLRYTHGYGVVMSPINEVSSEGLPNYFVSNIPPKTTTDLKMEKMGVYFGEMTGEYVFVGTSQDEFDYPTGDSTQTTRQDAVSGVSVGNFFRKLLFAIRFQDLNILLNANLTSESRLLYRRNVTERLNTLFPFLTLDFDPYLVLADGRLHWMVDAYTTTDRYPYSHGVAIGEQSLNYIRSSVKITVDAYTGEVAAYKIEKPLTDPIIRSYQKMFPGVFKDISEMPKSLQEHIRYPEWMFRTQNFIYETYHMSDPSVFYQRSDQWTIPATAHLEGSAGQETMEPYYTIMRLPNADSEEFILMTVFKRTAKTNMVAWMCAKCDAADYGKLVLYEFPDNKNVPGPDQIIARTNQDTYISQQLALWGQGTSSVSSGNLLVMPIDTSLLYVMPLYLESSSTKIPELKMVIVALGDRLVMEPTLQQALASVVGQSVKLNTPTAQASSATVQPATSAGGTSGLKELAKKAMTAYQKSQEALRTGNWSEYGKQQGELGKALNELRAKLGR